MTTEKKLQILKILKFGLLAIFVPIFLFYIAIVVPEYLACMNYHFEGEMGTDIWGNEVQCFGESKEFGEFFFEFLCEVLILILVLIGLVFWMGTRMNR